MTFVVPTLLITGSLLVIWLFANPVFSVLALALILSTGLHEKYLSEGRLTFTWKRFLARLAICNGYAGLLSVLLIGLSTRQPDYDFAVWQYGMVVAFGAVPLMALSLMGTFDSKNPLRR